MAGQLTPMFSFFCGVIRSSQHIYFALSDDELASQKIPSSSCVAWRKGGFAGFLAFEWLIAGLEIVQEPTPRLIVVGEYGQVTIAGDGTSSDEQDLQSILRGRGPLRRTRTIGGLVYVVGMDRQVFVRNGPRTWADIGPSPLPVGAAASPSGFEDIAGFSAAEIYAVGWDGEIWSFDGANWIRRASPTNMVLTAVCCADDGFVYAAGRRGLLLRGRHDSWDIIDQDTVSDDIWDLCSYREAPYLSTINSVYRLENLIPVEVQFGADNPATCFRLAAGHEVLCSVGAKDVLLFDGHTWTRID